MLRGIVFDRAHAVEGARQTIAAHGCTERCEAVAGDFFQAMATGGEGRSEAEFRTLFSAAGYQLVHMFPTALSFSILEGAPT